VSFRNRNSNLIRFCREVLNCVVLLRHFHRSAARPEVCSPGPTLETRHRINYGLTLRRAVPAFANATIVYLDSAQDQFVGSQVLAAKLWRTAHHTVGGLHPMTSLFNDVTLLESYVQISWPGDEQ
jgi:hypothetical protein